MTERDSLYGDTVIERLDREELKVWLERYTLGKLWTKGQIGGKVDRRAPSPSTVVASLGTLSLR